MSASVRPWGQALESVLLLERTGGVPTNYRKEAEQIRDLIDALAFKVVSPRSGRQIELDRQRRRLYRAYDGVFIRTGEHDRFMAEVARKGGGSC